MTFVCCYFGTSRQAFNQWRLRCARKDPSEQTIEVILSIIKDYRKIVPTAGIRKLHEAINRILGEGVIGRDKLNELLRENNLLNKPTARYQYKYSKNNINNYPINIYKELDHNKILPGQVLVSDITYLPKIGGGHYYLSLVSDVSTRAILGYMVSDNMDTGICIKSLKRSIKLLKEFKLYQKGWIHHSDRGSQYASGLYNLLVRKYKGKMSMTRGGAPDENAIAERINGILKQEFFLDVWPNDLESVNSEIKKAIRIYNHMRFHFSLKMKTPFEALLNEKQKIML